MNKREEILTLAKQAVNGEREQTYGSPEDSFERIARLWSTYLQQPVNGLDVAKMMILFKLARTGEHEYLDNWVDIAGYAACAGEIEHDAFRLGGAEKKGVVMEDVKKAVEVYQKRVREGEF